jgi:hypothetical protein
MKKVILFFLLPILFACINEDVDFRTNSENGINIYLVQDSMIGYFDDNVDFNSLKTEPIPWLKNSEIEFYDWSAHMFYLNTTKEKEKYAGRFFIVKAEDKYPPQSESLFIGLFFPMYMSSFPLYPAILAMDNFMSPEDVLGFSRFGGRGFEKLDQHLEFKSALISAGLFREGIDVELLKVIRKNSSTLEYTFRVTNKDVENIYVLDPSKMGVERFHYFTNGVALFYNQQYFHSQSERITVSEIKTSWYYKLAPQNSMVRTVTLGGFSNLPTGVVDYVFSFPGSVVKKGQWKKPDGRIWLGEKLIQGEINFR